MTVGVAVIGYGYWGVNLTRNVATAHTTDLIGVVDPAADRRALAEQNNPGITTWDSVDDALADARVDAVVIATPASTHVDLAIQCLEAGRDILVEKPLAETSADAEKIAQLAADRDRILMVGHTFLYSPSVHRLKSLIAEGDLGAVQYLYSQRLSLGRIRRDCNALWNFAPHDVSIMLHLLDEPVVEVTAKGFAFIDPEVDDVCFASMTFESGVGANLHVSWIDPRKTRLMTVVGDEKMAIYNDVSGRPAPLARGLRCGQGSGSRRRTRASSDFQWRTRSGDIVIPQNRDVGAAPQRDRPPSGQACHGPGTLPTDRRRVTASRWSGSSKRSIVRRPASGRPVEVSPVSAVNERRRDHQPDPVPGSRPGSTSRSVPSCAMRSTTSWSPHRRFVGAKAACSEFEEAFAAAHGRRPCRRRRGSGTDALALALRAALASAPATR